jgi:AcrR family transcriptional regulator
LKARPLTDRGEQRRRALLRAARDVFSKHGYEGASIEEVMRRVGGSKATLYTYFGNKEGLFLEVVREECDEFSRDLRIPAEADKDLEGTLIAIARRFLDMFIDSEALQLYRLIISEVVRFPDLARRFYEQGPRRSRQALGKYLRLQHEAGRINCPDAETAAAQFFELVLPHLRCTLGLPPFPAGQTRERHITSAVELFLNGCRRRPNGKSSSS